MRLILCRILLFLACGGTVWAQTNTPPIGPTTNGATGDEADWAMDESSEPPTVGMTSDEPGTHIYSDSVQLGIKTRTAIYRGHVRLDDPRIHLTCGQLTASVPEKGKRVDRVVAETNVVIMLTDDQGKTNRAYADKAVYTYSITELGTNEVVELTGDPSPRVEREEGILYGDTIVWDRTRNVIRATNQRMIYHAVPETLSNAVPVTTNPPAAATTSDE